MILLLDTSTPVCRLGIENKNVIEWHEWEANRELAKGLLAYVKNILATYSVSMQDVRGIGVFEGPGSFTGLRIGLTVMNTLADACSIPIAGGRGEEWAADALQKLKNNVNERIILPHYGSEAHITKPRK